MVVTNDGIQATGHNKTKLTVACAVSRLYFLPLISRQLSDSRAYNSDMPMLRFFAKFAPSQYL